MMKPIGRPSVPSEQSFLWTHRSFIILYTAVLSDPRIRAHGYEDNLNRSAIINESLYEQRLDSAFGSAGVLIMSVKYLLKNSLH